ncbi:MAG: twin-arginine translocase subunit TatC [Candidatus Sericytochromatia bacterium]|nr:twin-arginine translocase subunit TatC [Candidatus Sericytochromatia bacterium]
MPAGTIQFGVIGPSEAFLTSIPLSLYAGIALAMPRLPFELGAFLWPGLSPDGQRWLAPLLGASLVLFLLGGWFAYALLQPTGLAFLLGFAPVKVQAMLLLGEYVRFAGAVVFAVSLLCQLPVGLFTLGWTGLLRSKQLSGWRRYALLGGFFLGMVLSPSPDLVTQGLMAGLVMVLYEASIVLMRSSGH